MYATERQELIERLLRDEGRVSVVDLARRLEVTTETVRRDLDRLEIDGLLRRVHGGAVPTGRGSTAETTLAERMLQHTGAKDAIARRALAAITPGFRGSIFIDAGTTAAAVAAALPAHLAAVGGTAQVVTHSMPVASSLAGAPETALTVIGGRVRGVTAAAVGAETVRAIGELRPDVAFVGTNGLSAAFGLSTPDPDEAAVKAEIIRVARRVVVVADAGKFDAELLVRVAALAEVDVVVSDAAPGGDLAAALDEADAEVWVA
jgi:DeoR family transcriptional regulator, fructose operon transcriptional repressor